MSKINQLVRKVYNFKLRKSLKNENITLISSNCVGACILNDLGVRFNSPFVNLWIKPKDFLKICENLSYYMKQSLTFIQIKGIDYPVALLGDVSIYFQHYKSEKEAEECWNRRVKRMNLNHIYIYIYASLIEMVVPMRI